MEFNLKVEEVTTDFFLNSILNKNNTCEKVLSAENDTFLLYLVRVEKYIPEYGETLHPFMVYVCNKVTNDALEYQIAPTHQICAKSIFLSMKKTIIG